MPSHAIALKQLTSLVFQKPPPLETNRRIKESVQLYFIKKNDQHRQTYLVATRENSVSSKNLCEAHIKIFECLIDNVFVMLDERVFQQTVDNHKGTNCAPIYTGFFNYLHEWTSMQEILKGNENSWSGPLISRFSKQIISFHKILQADRQHNSIKKDKQRSTKDMHKTKDRVTLIPLKRGVSSGAS